jgi:hypothetical protein
VPDTLAYLLEAWDKGANFEQALNDVDNKLVYLRPSWYCIFAGMQRFSSKGRPDCGLSDVKNVSAIKVMAKSVNGVLVTP